jgi:hypothetical protein
MRIAKYNERIEELLAQGRELSVADFTEVLEGMPMASVYTRIRALCEVGHLSRMGRGRYRPVHKPAYREEITPWMREVNEFFLDDCVGIDHCLYQRDGNLYVEAVRSDLPALMDCLGKHYKKVVNAEAAERFPAALEGYIIVGPLISEAPVLEEDGIPVPSLEKKMVDAIRRKDAPMESFHQEFQRKMEVYPVNVNRMGRYAARRGVSEELSSCIAGLDESRIKLFSEVQSCLAGMPILRAWVFGSFARGEETPESDLDLLVDYDHEVKISLLDIVRFKLDIEKKIHREVDLVENGYLKPFAVASVEQDKYLIYER